MCVAQLASCIKFGMAGLEYEHVLDPLVPEHALSLAAPRLLKWGAICLFAIAPFIHYCVIILSRRVAGYRALPAAHQSEWNQSVIMTLVIPTILFPFFTKLTWECSGSLHSRSNCYIPWSRDGRYFCRPTLEKSSKEERATLRMCYPISLHNIMLFPETLPLNPQ